MTMQLSNQQKLNGSPNNETAARERFITTAAHRNALGGWEGGRKVGRGGAERRRSREEEGGGALVATWNPGQKEEWSNPGKMTTGFLVSWNTVLFPAE